MCWEVSRRRVAAGGDRAAVILPLYGQVSDAWREKMRWHGYTYVDLAWRHAVLRPVLAGVSGRRLVFSG